MVGAKSFVNTDLEDYGIYAGIPARRIGYRFDKRTRSALLRIKWWKWSDKKIETNFMFFQNPIKFVENFDV